MQKLWFLCLVLFAIPVWPQVRTVAITFDDLPLADSLEGSTPTEKLAEMKAVNKALVKALSKHRAHAIAFVNEEKVRADGRTKENRAALREWTNHGYDLGNHSYSHADFDKLSVEQFEKEILDGEPSARLLMKEKNKTLRYFCFPFNHTGETAEKHDAIAVFLQQHGYELAACTIDTSDWIFARKYTLMLAHKDTNSARRFRAEYLAFTRKEIEYYGQLSQGIFNRDIPQVMLLHASRLNADTMNQVLQIFSELDYKFVSLEEAQADAAYKMPDTYFTKFGPMWGYRWATQKHIKVDGKLEPEVPDWIENYK